MQSEEAEDNKDKQMMKIAIIGSGLIGRAWAVVFAHAGHQVVMQDTDEACLDKLSDTVMQEAAILGCLLSSIPASKNNFHPRKPGSTYVM